MLKKLPYLLERYPRDGQVQDYADLARLGHVSRARVTEIMNMLHLTPDIQEEILFLPRTVKGQDSISDRQIDETSWSEPRGLSQEY